MKRNYYIVSLIMLTFFVISFLTNIIGPLIPDIIKDFHLSLTLVALLPFAFFIAYGVMSIPSGMLVEKYKEKKIMIAAFIVSFFGALLLAVSPGYLTAVLSLFLIGCARTRPHGQRDRSMQGVRELSPLPHAPRAEPRGARGCSG